ncbi:uncharacterized protein [Macrobrachium rosenbergii]|uniref:uncharacterized protein n=1 Tax=Macrobrachium rosenbergii TaxID=79674 RepID=UPI0034D74BD5
MTRLNFLQPSDFQPEVLKIWDRALLLLVIAVMSSPCCVEANQNFSGNTAQEGASRFQGSFQLNENELRCDHLLTLRAQHYSLLLASLRLAESMEDSLNNSQHAKEIDEFQLARSSYLASWDQVQEDMEKVASSSLFPEILSENQCEAGNHCSPNTWDLGCYHCLPGRDGSLPPSCSHNTLSTEFLRVVDKKARSVQEPLRGRSCIDSTIEKEMVNVKKQLDSMMIAVNDICSSGNGVELPKLQNIYDNAQFLELSTEGMRREIVKQHGDISVSCDVPTGELSIIKVEDVSESVSGESGIKITVDVLNPCAKYVFVGGSLISSPSGPCWYINEDKTTASLEESTGTPSLTLTTSHITRITDEMFTHTSTEESSSLSFKNYSTEAPYNTTVHETPTDMYHHCSQDLQEMIDNLHHDIPHIAEDFAQISLKSAECIREADSLHEVEEIIHLLEVFADKAKEVLNILKGNMKNRQHQRSATTEGRIASYRKMSASLSRLRALLEYLRSSAVTLQSGSDWQDAKNRVIAAVQHIANMFTQGDAVDHEI